MRQPQKIADASDVDDRNDTLTELVDRLADSVGTLNERVDSLTRGSAQCFAAMLSSVQAVRDSFCAIAQGVSTAELRIVDRAGRVLATLGPDAGGRGELVLCDPGSGATASFHPPGEYSLNAVAAQNH